MKAGPRHRDPDPSTRTRRVSSGVGGAELFCLREPPGQVVPPGCPTSARRTGSSRSSGTPTSRRRASRTSRATTLGGVEPQLRGGGIRWPDPIVDPLADVLRRRPVSSGLNTAARVPSPGAPHPLKRAKELPQGHPRLQPEFVPQDTQKQSTFGSFQRTGQPGNRPLNPDKPSEKGVRRRPAEQHHRAA